MSSVLEKKDTITTARLPIEVRNKLVYLAKVKKKSKSQIIIDALELYYKQDEEEFVDSYKIGLPYFGKYNLGPGDLSVTYKERLREKLWERHRARSSSN